MGQKIAILYGLNEGPGMGKKLRLSLEKAGYSMTSDPRRADIIFAHSGGCFLIPTDNHASLVMLVGLPYWPHRPWFIATVVKVWREFKAYKNRHHMRQWLRKWAYHVLYAFRLPSAVRMGLNMSPSNTWNSLQPQVIVRNHQEAYCNPSVAGVAFRGPRTFISLPGEHDDCWDNPEPYIGIIKSLS